MSHHFLNFHRGELHKALHLPDKIPADFEGTFVNVPAYQYPLAWWEKDDRPDRDLHRMHPFIGHFTIVVTKTKGDGKVKVSNHRVFVKCKCGKLVPAGRMGQHKCDHWPPADLIAKDREIVERNKRDYEDRLRKSKETQIAKVRQNITEGKYDEPSKLEYFRWDLVTGHYNTEGNRNFVMGKLEEYESLPVRERLTRIVDEFVPKAG